MNPRPEPGLSSLIAPFDTERFLSEHWPEKPLHLEGPVERLRDLLGVPALHDFRTLERVWPNDALVLSKRGGDESGGISIPSPAIRRVFDAGLPMFLHRPERVFPELQRWVDALRADLGFPAQGQFLCSTHASPGGTATAMHFDDAVSFILQLSGTKTWRIAPNRSIPNPPGRYSVAMPALDGSLAPYLSSELPKEMPPDTTTVTLTPGSVLFLPSGWWHAVDGVDESLALMFIGLSYTWADVVARAVRRELLKNTAWRRLAVGAGVDDPAQRARATAELGRMLQELPDAVSRLSAEAMVMPRYLRNKLTSCHVETDGVVFESDDAISRVRLPEVHRHLVASIAAGPGAFTASDVVAAGNDPATVSAVLDVLVDVGFVRKE